MANFPIVDEVGRGKGHVVIDNTHNDRVVWAVFRASYSSSSHCMMIDKCRRHRFKVFRYPGMENVITMELRNKSPDVGAVIMKRTTIPVPGLQFVLKHAELCGGADDWEVLQLPRFKVGRTKKHARRPKDFGSVPRAKSKFGEGPTRRMGVVSTAPRFAATKSPSNSKSNSLASMFESLS